MMVMMRMRMMKMMVLIRTRIASLSDLSGSSFVEAQGVAAASEDGDDEGNEDNDECDV